MHLLWTVAVLRLVILPTLRLARLPVQGEAMSTDAACIVGVLIGASISLSLSLLGLSRPLLRIADALETLNRERRTR